MENFKHCEICDLHSSNLNDGIICSLTNKKPAFNIKCPDIKLDKNLKEKIIEINTEFEDSKRVKRLAVGNLVLYGLIGLGVIWVSYYLINQFYRIALVHTGTLAIFFIGIGIIGIGVGAINYSMRKSNVIAPKKNRLDKLTELYKVKYEFSSKVSTDIMGTTETKLRLRFNGKEIEKIIRF